MQDVKHYKDTIDLFLNKISKLFNHLFPGVFIIELFFNKGLFSTPPDNIYTFSLYLIWCAVLSIPYHSILPISIQKIGDSINKVARIHYGFTKEEYDKTVTEEDLEMFSDFQDALVLGFILIRLVMTYTIFKFLNAICLPNIKLIGIPINISQLIITVFVMILISYPTGYLYIKVVNRQVRKYLQRK